VTPDHPIPSTSDRLRALQRRLDRPDDGWSWLWRIHARVCRYLLGPDEPAEASPGRSVVRDDLDDLKTPYVTTREPSTEELRMRALSRVKVARLMRDMDGLGPHVTAEAGAAAEVERRFQQRYDAVTRIAWRILGLVFIIMFAPLLIASVIVLAMYAQVELASLPEYERASVVFILFGLTVGPTAVVWRLLRDARARGR
jgi:hypothetical protein